MSDTLIDRSIPAKPREVHQDHLDADADHAVVAVSGHGDGISDNCGVCGLASTGDGMRHGFDE